MDDRLTVVIRPLGDPDLSGSSPIAITGAGTALYELLSGWCDGFLEHPLTRNCGVDHAFTDWMWEPFRAGSSLDEIETQIRINAADADFPLRTLVHESGLPDCPDGSRLPHRLSRTPRDRISSWGSGSLRPTSGPATSCTAGGPRSRSATAGPSSTSIRPRSPVEQVR
jgi:hypothetical protein